MLKVLSHGAGAVRGWVMVEVLIVFLVLLRGVLTCAASSIEC